MIDRDLIKHGAEFKRALANHQYEMTEHGIYFPMARAFGGGEYFFDTNGENPGTAPNLIPTQGFNYLLDVGMRTQSAVAAWYLGLFSGAYTPVDGVTAATWVSAATEITSNSNGYSETTRRLWTPDGAAAGGIVTNASGAAAFTIATSTSVTIRGAALVSEQAKGSGAGVLASISRFSVDRLHYNGDVFNLGYRMRLRPE